MTRAHHPESIPGAKKLTLDKHKLFYKYDYENTLLNGPKSIDKSYQNARVYVDENGQRLKD